jgi:rod shape-determining protein MreC
VEAHLSRVRLLADRSSAVSARVQRSSVDGIVEGSPVEGLWLRFVPTSADVRIGDVVMTSGLGGAFPAGIPVGTVAALGIEEGGLLRRIRVKPVAPTETLEDVFVLAPGDSSRQWGFLWSVPRAPVDSLTRSLGSEGIAP